MITSTEILALYSKPSSEKFTKEEIRKIKSVTPKNKFKVRYATYKKESIKGIYIALIIDYAPNSPRRSGIRNHWDFIDERPLTNIEYQEEIENFGCCNRRFKMFYYRSIHSLIYWEKKAYNVDVPQKFIDTCIEKGLVEGFQLPLELVN